MIRFVVVPGFIGARGVKWSPPSQYAAWCFAEYFFRLWIAASFRRMRTPYRRARRKGISLSSLALQPATSLDPCDSEQAAPAGALGAVQRLWGCGRRWRSGRGWYLAIDGEAHLAAGRPTRRAQPVVAGGRGR